ncbi:hypothetical protein Scep_020715 [Stephania cephalantha]|uniref:RBR-type E3 ubiquitin transferase n=1 Tax=Stephania cephalantha TaxID=152367 RepID=A0AAP0ID49_9MAGN
MGEYLSGDDDDYYSDPDSQEPPFRNDDNDDDREATRSPPSSNKVVIRKEHLLLAQMGDLRRVMDLLKLREQHARTLLIHYRWDVDRLVEVLAEMGKDRLFAQAGVILPGNTTTPLLQSSSIITCNICMEDVCSREFTTMDCGHCYCNNCWSEHFIVRIKEGQSKRIRCMEHKCNAICDEAVVRKLVSTRDPDLAERFDRFLLESYVEDNKIVKWCPSVPHCGNAIRVEDDKYCEVECACGFQFCFSCSSEVHSPCSCIMWELWTKKCLDESETVNWITVNTKPCPKCHKPVEKNGGCNLVRCICGQPFCWLCGGATGRDHTWSSIRGHSCGRYKEEGEQKKAERAKRELYRYMHYYNRFKAHTDSFKLESKLVETMMDKISAVERRIYHLNDFSWLTNGLNRLFRSRRVLSYSYAFAYYMFGEELFPDEMTKEIKEIKQNLFEDQQQQFEFNVEQLSKYLEEPFNEYSEDKVMEIRMQVINFSEIVNSRCEQMYECIENDLLGSLERATHCIAPYNSKGVEKASLWSTKVDNSGSHPPHDVKGPPPQDIKGPSPELIQDYQS